MGECSITTTTVRVDNGEEIDKVELVKDQTGPEIETPGDTELTVGDEFDPNLHEALMQQPSDEVETPTLFLVMQPGYRIGERIIRAARVGVQQPED